MGPKVPPTLANLELLHRELGIPASYATDRGLTPYAAAGADELVELDRGTTLDGRSVLLLRAAAFAWRQLHGAATHDGVELIAISGFRSVTRQAEIIRAKLSRGDAIEKILRVVAAPGFSQHHGGCALDIGSPGHFELDEAFGATPAFH